jgi:transcriptional regulator with XRE-family HTH domain
MEHKDPTPLLAARIREERRLRDWTLDEFARRSGVSKAMLSKLERAESSPTAALLGKISGALGLTLGDLLTSVETSRGRLIRAGEQPVWKDPRSGYIRRQVTPANAQGVQLIEVELPAGTHVVFPASAYAFIRQWIWVLAGVLHFAEGESEHTLGAGDCLHLGSPADCVFRNPGRRSCRYLVAITPR